MEAKTILKTLKEASPFDIFLISFIALPFVFEAWLRILKALEVGLNAKYLSLGLILLAYVAGIISMLIGANKEKRRESAKDQIISYLTRNDIEMMRLERIQDKINSGYQYEFLESLPIYFPGEIRRAKLKGNNRGLARIIESKEADDT